MYRNILKEIVKLENMKAQPREGEDWKKEVRNYAEENTDCLEEDEE